MLTLRKLVTATPRPILIRALMQCRVNITRAVQDADEFGNPVKECAGLVRATDGDRFAVLMFYNPEKKNLAESKIWAHCSCPYFTFNVEVTNTLRKSSDIINSNGELPVVRNPRMIPHFCKHLVALAKLAVKAKYKEIAKKKPNKDLGKQGKVPPAKALERPGQKAEPGRQQLKRPPAVKSPPRPGAKPPKSVPSPTTRQQGRPPPAKPAPRSPGGTKQVPKEQPGRQGLRRPGV